MTSIPLQLEQPARPSPLLQFLGVQSVVWAAYGLALMLPWLGEYSVAVMLPNKLVIAATGVVASVLLRGIYRRAGASLGVIGAACALIGALWSAALTLLLGRSPSAELWALGSLSGGVPRFGGALYEMFVLCAWSLLYVGIRRGRDPGTPTVHTVGQSDELIVARDASRALVADAGEIDWVEAAGDYVRLHVGGRQVLLRGTMASYEAGLGTGYVRIHRSTIVNVARVRELLARPNKEYVVVLRDGTRLRASRMYSRRLLDAIRP